MEKLIDLKLWQQSQQQLLSNNQRMQHLIVDQCKYSDNYNQMSTICEESVVTDECSSVCDTDFDDNHVIQSSESFIKDIYVTSACINKPMLTCMESSPVTPGIDGNKIKTFEELLNKTLGNEENVNSDNANLESKPKQPFLKKGDGLKRYCSNNNSNTITTKSNQLSSCNRKNATKSKTFEQKQTKIEKKILKPKLSDNKLIVNANKLNGNMLKKCDDKQQTKLKFNKKVIALTTKCDTKPCVKNKITITRNNHNQPYIRNTKCKEIDDNRIFGYSDNKNIVYDSNNFNDIDIDVLQTLLKKVEQKKRRMKKKIDDNDYWTDISDNEIQHKKSKKINSKLKTRKKKVRWNQNMDTVHNTNIGMNPKLSDDCIELDVPKFGAYSLAMKKQINALESRLSELRLQCAQNKQSKNDCESELKISSIHVLESIKEVNKQMETLNKRLINIETRAYDMSSKNIAHKINSSKPSKDKPNSSKYVKKHNENSSVTEHENYTNIEFTNGDRMKITDDNTMFYRYSNGATQTTYSDGLKIINFPNGQIEKTHKNGVKHITYSNGSQRIINIDGSEEVITEDGTMLRIHKDGTEYIEFKNGDREVRTDRYKRREYRNGTIKTLYTDGTEETRFINGRLRIKDVSGNIIVDSHVKHLNVE